MKNLKPIFIKNSKVPKYLSTFAPISIGAIALFPFVFCIGELSKRKEIHETIHFQQQLETGVLFFYLIYLWDYIKLRISGKSGHAAYLGIRAEKEAYLNQLNGKYLQQRKRWTWLRRK